MNKTSDKRVSLREACEHAEAMLRDGGTFPIKGQTWRLLHDALEEAPSARGEGWVPVSERTPVHADTVLFISASGYTLGHYAAGAWWDEGQEDNWPPAREVSHWMALPKKPGKT